MLSSELLFDISEHWNYASAHYLQMKNLTSEYNLVHERIKKRAGDGEELYNRDIQIGTEFHNTELAYNGIIFKMTRQLADFIEADIKENTK